MAARLWAFDFDGVICDSSRETGLAGLSVCLKDLGCAPPDAETRERILSDFDRVRPILETGWEGVLMVYLLLQGQTVEQVLEHFHASSKQETMTALGKDEAMLKALLQRTRDQVLAESEQTWISMNGFYEEALAALADLVQRGELVYIISTKAGPLVTLLLNSRGVHLPAGRVYGLGSGPKPDVVQKLQQAHPEAKVFFIEDRAETLELFCHRGLAPAVDLAFARWGYSTAADQARIAANQHVRFFETQTQFASYVRDSLTQQT